MAGRSRLAQWLLTIGALVTLPVVGQAQEATIGGSVTDSTGGVLPGVTITAVQTETGNTFVAVTDSRGEYRIPVRTGPYKLTLELSGFTTLTRTLELRVGQEAVLNLPMVLASVQETVTVTSAVPLVDTTRSSLGANIDPRQAQELPLNGGNFQDLTLLAAGSRANAAVDMPVERVLGGAYQLNIDGQQVTQIFSATGGGYGNARFSRDAIAEFQVVTNRFDASQGRSNTLQVNVVTKSGTNTPAGTFAGYFRNDALMAANHVVNQVLPYSDQQVSATFGGPIRKDRVHMFANFQYEREPQTFVFNPPYPSFASDLTVIRREHQGGGRLDVEFTPQTRLAVRASTWRNFFPAGATHTNLVNSTQTLGSLVQNKRWTHQIQGTLTQVLSTKAVNELKVGFATFRSKSSSLVKSAPVPGLQLPPELAVGYGAPNILLRGLTIGLPNVFAPQLIPQDTYSIRDNLTYSYTAGGRHDLKVGGEFLYYPNHNFSCNNCFGTLLANVATRPANLETLFPDVLDATTWSLAPLSRIAISWTQTFGNFGWDAPRYVTAAWAQDDWAITRRLTLNLGVRYDLQANAFANSIGILPWVQPNRPNENNFSPRLGAVYSLNDRMVVRAGFGKFHGEIGNGYSQFFHQYTQTIAPEVLNDGRPDFASNPYNGPTPTYDQLLGNLCTPAAPLVPGCIRRSLTAGSSISGDTHISYSNQASIGVQRQLGTTMSMTADYEFQGGRREPAPFNANLTYNPITGANYPFTNLSNRLYPDWGPVLVALAAGRSNYHALVTSFTKQFRVSVWDG